MSTKPSPADFDLDAYVEGRIDNTTTIDVSVKTGLVSRVRDLQAERATLAETKRPAKSKRLAEKDDPRLAEVEDEIRAALEELDGSWLTIQVRTPSPREYRDAMAAAEDEFDKITALLAVVAQVRKQDAEKWSNLTAEQWATLVEAIGRPQFALIDKAVADVTYTKGVTPDFSRRVLSSLSTEESSSS